MDVKRMVSVLIFSALFIAGASFYHPVDYDNTSSRYFLVSALVDYGTLNIDVNEKGTIDKSFFDGHYYSNKAIGAPLLGAPIYWCMRHFPYVKQSAPLLPSARFIIRLLTTTLPFALLGVVMFHLACRLGAPVGKAFLMVMAYGFGTIALVHATLFSGHQITAAFAFFSFALVLQPAEQRQKSSTVGQPLKYFLAGSCAGLAVITDFPAIITAFFLTIYVLASTRPARDLILFFCGGLICAAVIVGYNLRCFGHPFSMSYSHLSLEEFRAEASVGLFGVNTPSFRTMMALLFSPARGIFTIMPVLILSVTGLWAMFALKQFRKEALLIIAISLGYLVFNSGYCGWHGGWTFGPRYLVGMLPFLAFAIAFGRWSSFAFLLLFLLSAFQVLPAVAGLPHTPDDIRNPLIEIILPCMGQGYLATNAGMLLKIPGLYSILPIAAVVGLLVCIAIKRINAIQGEKPEEDSKFFKFGMYFWIVTIICLLAYVKTEPEKLIHAYRYKLLYHAGWNLKSIELIKAADRESVLAGDLGNK